MTKYKILWCVFFFSSCKTRSFENSKTRNIFQETNQLNIDFTNFQSIQNSANLISRELQKRKSASSDGFSFEVPEWIPVLVKLEHELQKRIAQAEQKENLDPPSKWNLGEYKIDSETVKKLAQQQKEPNIDCMRESLVLSQKSTSQPTLLYSKFWELSSMLMQAFLGCGNYFGTIHYQEIEAGIAFPVLNKELSKKDFVKMRGSFIHPIGLMFHTSNADGNLMWPVSFANHDVVHSRKMDSVDKRKICASEFIKEPRSWFECAQKIQMQYSKILNKLEALESTTLWDLFFLLGHKRFESPEFSLNQYAGSIDKLTKDLKTRNTLKKKCLPETIGERMVEDFVAERNKRSEPRSNVMLTLLSDPLYKDAAIECFLISIE